MFRPFNNTKLGIRASHLDHLDVSIEKRINSYAHIESTHESPKGYIRYHSDQRADVRSVVARQSNSEYHCLPR